MTTYTDAAPLRSDLNAPVLPEDRARAAQLWEAVKGTALEAPYRQVSTVHAEKALNRANYLNFLEALEELFVATPVQNAAPVAAFDPERRSLPVEVTAAPVTEETEADPETDSDEEGPVAVEPDENLPVAVESDEPTLPAGEGAGSALFIPQSSGLLAQLAGLLADGGQLTLQLLRVGDQLTLGIFPQPHPGEAQSQPLMVTETPAWLNLHLVQAMQGYANARRDAFQICQGAAQKQQQLNHKATEKPKTPASPAKGKRFQVVLSAAPGTILHSDVGGTAGELIIGENDVPQGNLMITATHPLFGEVKKTLSVYANKTHNFEEQQGGRVRVTVTPVDAALTATKGETTVAFHGGTLLPAGRWTISAEAAEHEAASQLVTVRAGKEEPVTLTLTPITINLLF
jgi:PRTRC genetic system protein E